MTAATKKPWQRAGLLVVMLAAAFAGPRAAACGLDEPCTVPSGEYYAVAPEPAPDAGPRPAVIFFHGAGGSGQGVVADAGLVEPLVDRGWVVIAPEGRPPPDRAGNNWAVADGRTPWRDEYGFVQEILADATGRFDLDRSRVIAAGFSRGGSLVWDLACRHPEEFAAFAPVAGGFWRPQPESCVDAAIRLRHVHGFVDTTVPLEGRTSAKSGRGQADIFAGLALLRRTQHCPSDRPDAFVMGDTLDCRIWSACAPGAELQFCLHDGGHGVPPGWAAATLDWFETDAD